MLLRFWKVLVEGERPGAYRPQNVITFEIAAYSGRWPGNYHDSCRTQQSGYAGYYGRILIRGFVESGIFFKCSAGTLVNLAEKHKDTIVLIIPNGVVAQPNSYGHYLLAYADGFNRDMERVQQYYVRLNLSPGELWFEWYQLAAEQRQDGWCILVLTAWRIIFTTPVRFIPMIMLKAVPWLPAWPYT